MLLFFGFTSTQSTASEQLLLGLVVPSRVGTFTQSYIGAYLYNKGTKEITTMDLDQLIKYILTLFETSNGNMLYVAYAIFVVVLTQITKKIFVNKVNIEIFHSFDLATILPFVYGLVAAIFDRLVVDKTWLWTGNFMYLLCLHATSLGAMAVIIFKIISTISGKNMTALLKDDTFAIFYNQLVYFGSVKEQLASGELDFSTFLDEVKLVVSNAKTIYASTTDTDNTKKTYLTELLKGIITTDNVTTVVEAIHKAMLSLNATATATTTE